MRLALLCALAGCGSATSDSGVEPCSYPGGVEPMAVGEVLSPYAWPEARHADGRQLALDLARVACPVDPADIEWSAFDLLLFVSIPAW